MEQEQSMTLESFRQARDSGVDLHAETQVDAAPTIDSTPDIDTHEDVPDTQENQQDAPEVDESDDGSNEVEIPKEHQTAWAKRAERERRKAAEETEARLKTEYESQLNPYKKFFDNLGMDPEAAMQAMEQTRIKQEAENLAYQNGWSEDQAQMYIRQQELERSQTEMKVGLRVYELADSADYPGIKQMKGAITDFVRSNPRTTVEQAYWAVGGANLAQQIKREVEQREKATRTQTKRTVISDAPTDMKGPAPLTDEDVTFMKRTKMSEQQLRFLKDDKGPQTLEDYRNMMKKGKG